MSSLAPDRDAASFVCPWCGADARQRWFPFVVGYAHKGNGRTPAWRGMGREAEGIAISFCEHCHRPMVWHDRRPIWPATTSAPPPAKDMPAAARADFEEARQVVDRSPQSAAALLRLSLQKLCRYLGRPGRSIDDDIRDLVASGLPDWVPPALHVARTVGSDAVRPGELDARDDRDTAFALFALVNTVVDKMITEPAMWRV